MPYPGWSDKDIRILKEEKTTRGAPPGDKAIALVLLGLVSALLWTGQVWQALAAILAVMAAAVIVSTLMMMFAAQPVSAFIERRPTAKVLALAFILLVGTALVADGAGFHVPRGYLYFAMGFSLAVELLNGRRAKRRRRSKQGTNVVQSRNESA